MLVVKDVDQRPPRIGKARIHRMERLADSGKLSSDGRVGAMSEMLSDGRIGLMSERLSEGRIGIASEMPSDGRVGVVSEASKRTSASSRSSLRWRGVRFADRSATNAWLSARESCWSSFGYHYHVLDHTNFLMPNQSGNDVEESMLVEWNTLRNE
jgi:hypothetical protein